MGNWVKACAKDQLGINEMFSFDHEDKRLLITNLGGKIYATDRICTHAEADLSLGFVTEEGVRCPLHLSVFNLENGKPLNPPAEKPLKTYNIKIDQNAIYVEV
ncbi:MAG TPA: non-heme iron oxygenase ferredoxin subunit [Candidatus Nitrosotenuis sp.]